MEVTVEALRHISLFADLSDDALSRLGDVLVRRDYAPDETIIVEGLPCRAVYFVADGHVRVSRIAVGGREQVLARLGPGQSFNTIPPFQSDSVNHATVQAVEPVTLYSLPCEDLRRLINQCPELALALLHEFADRLDRLTDLVEDLSLRTVRGRLARFLLEHAGEGEVTQRWTQAEIAARLGTVREVVGRSLRSFADAGLIRIERQRITLLDREGLEDEVHS